MAAKFSLDEIVLATGGVLDKPCGMNETVYGISTDTRTLTSGDAFFALIGENHDAHDHLDKAAEMGATLLVVNNAEKVPRDYSGAVMIVEDTLMAYQSVAAYYRKRLDPLVIAVTGSVGKTTVKDMIAWILSDRVFTYSTKGNINNQIGLPRTILEAEEGTRVLVLEMGLATVGDIKRLADIARPDIAVITNIGVAHRENFDTDDGILKAKFEVTSYMDEKSALVIDVGGSKEVADYAEENRADIGYKLLSDFSISTVRVDEKDAGVSVFEIQETGSGISIPFSIPLPGPHAGISTALAAVCCIRAGEMLGEKITLADVANSLKGLERTRHRLEPISAGDILVIDDTYNASPDSAKAGLNYLKSVPAKRRFAILADMNELGYLSEEMHERLGEAAVLAGADLICAFGTKAKSIAEGAKQALKKTGTKADEEVLWFDADDKDALIECVQNKASKGDVIYIKGSRAMKMEDVVYALTKGKGGND